MASCVDPHDTAFKAVLSESDRFVYGCILVWKTERVKRQDVLDS